MLSSHGARPSAAGLALVLLGVVACGSPPALAPPPAATTTSHVTVSPERALQSLREGDVQQARLGYRALAADREELGAAGLIAVALAEDDRPALTALLAAVTPESAGAELLVGAALAALRLGLGPDRTDVLRQRVCAARSDPRLGRDAAEVCARLTARALTRERNRCVAGCDQTTRLPLAFVFGIPVVMVAVGDAEPVPFIVDTGASSALITAEHARRAGVTPVAGSEHQVGAAGGNDVPATLANLTLQLGDVRIAGAEAVVLDLPIEGIGGIVSPQTTLADLRVTLDFSSCAFTLEPPGNAVKGGLASWPWLLHERRPVVVAEVGDRPPRPLLLDTGAQGSLIAERLDALGQPLPRKSEGKGQGAGASETLTWQTEGQVPVRAGQVTWQADSPSVARRQGPRAFPAIEVLGTIGVDFFMGRTLTLSGGERRLWISPEAELKPWKVGDRTRYRIEVAGFAQPFGLEEQVVERDGELLTIEAKLEHPATPQHFRFRMQDGWKARGSWLVTRKALALWDVGDQGLSARPPEKLAERYAPAFVSFKTKGAPTISTVAMHQGATSLLCTDLIVPAEARGGEAAFRMIECPSETWRVVQLELTAADGTTLWRVRRADVETASRP